VLLVGRASQPRDKKRWTRDQTTAPLDAAPSEHQTQPHNTEGMRLSDQIAAVLRMTQSELLDYVIAHPHYLTDVFYKDLAAAIKRRRAELALIPSSRRRSNS
jgi:hypothetical protein